MYPVCNGCSSSICSHVKMKLKSHLFFPVLSQKYEAGRQAVGFELVVHTARLVKSWLSLCSGPGQISSAGSQIFNAHCKL